MEASDITVEGKLLTRLEASDITVEGKLLISSFGISCFIIVLGIMVTPVGKTDDPEVGRSMAQGFAFLLIVEIEGTRLVLLLLLRVLTPGR